MTKKRSPGSGWYQPPLPWLDENQESIRPRSVCAPAGVDPLPPSDAPILTGPPRRSAMSAQGSKDLNYPESGRLVRPRIGPASCCRRRVCDKPLTKRTTARIIVRHALANPRLGIADCRVSNEDAVTLALFIQHRPLHYVSDERLLVWATAFAFMRRAARQQLSGYHGLAELDDFDQEACIALKLATRFDPSIAPALTTPLGLLLKRGFDILGGQLARYVALSPAMHRRMRGIAWRVSRREIQDGRSLTDYEFHLIVEEVAGVGVSLETARAHRRLLRHGRYLGELTQEQLDQSMLRGAAIISAAPSVALLSEDDALEILTRGEVVAALARLSRKQRERIAKLIGLDGCEAHCRTEIARLLRISRQAVGQTINKGLRRLQNSRHRIQLDQVEIQRRARRRQAG